MKKVLVILGHPSSQSFCNAVAEKYAEGAESAHAEVRFLKLGELTFNPVLNANAEVRSGQKEAQALEPDLVKAQQDITWADHLVFVYPSWWGMMPALLKGFIDRVFLPRFAFKYQQGKSMPEQLLKGKTARLIVTMDTPSWWNRFIYRAAGHNAMKHALLHFCGVRPVQITDLAGMRQATAEKRTKWLEHIQTIAIKDIGQAKKVVTPKAIAIKQ